MIIRDETKRGNRYFLIQESPGTFHVSIQYKDKVLYDYYEGIESKERLNNLIELLEDELYPRQLSEISSNNAY